MKAVPLDDYTITVRECRIDWLTLTNNSSSDVHILLRRGQELLDVVDPDHTQRKPWYWRNYTGETADWLRVGSREDSDILIITGPSADDFAPRLLPVATNCTRIDLAVTVHVQGEERDWAGEYYNQGIKWGQGRGNAPGYGYVCNSAGGSTAYVGSRDSDLFGRIYNKQAESGRQEFEGCWRFEVECKGDIASRTAERWLASDDRVGFARDCVYNYFDRRGCTPLFPNSNPNLRLATIRPRTDHASRLYWLSTQVRPAVARLVAGGYFLHVVEALGLDPANVDRLRQYYTDDHHGIED